VRGGARAAGTARSADAGRPAGRSRRSPILVSGRRLLFVADSLQVGGAERVLVELAAGLVTRGARVMLAVSVGGSLALEAERAGIDVRVLGERLVKRRFDHDFADALSQLISGDPPDLVHTHMFASTVAASEGSCRFGVPLVIHEHSEAGWRDGAARRRVAVAYSRSSAVIAVSAAIGRRLVQLDRVPPEKVHVVMNALPSLAHRLLGPGLPSGNGPLVGVVARLQPEKGVAVFLRAAGRLIQSVPAARFVVIGDGPQRASLERLAANLGVPVTFMGFRLDGAALLGALDLLVVPSFSEGTPLVALEAAAAGVPMVASAVGGIPEQACHEVEALLVAPGDAAALEAACLRILLHPALAAQLAAAARRKLRETDPHAQLDAVEALYRQVLNAEPVGLGTP
jgi:glycosyltransferase involved in cell wall biosynthesis